MKILAEFSVRSDFLAEWKTAFRPESEPWKWIYQYT